MIVSEKMEIAEEDVKMEVNAAVGYTGSKDDETESRTITKGPKGKTRKICPQCGAEVLDVNKHLKRVCNKKPEQLDLKCPDCGRACTNRNQLTLHWSYVHEVVPNLFCNLCAKPCTNRMKLRQHTMVCLQKMKNNRDAIVEPLATQWQPEQNPTSSSNNVEEDLACNLCRESYKSMLKLKRHTKKCLKNYLMHNDERQNNKEDLDSKDESTNSNDDARTKQIIECNDCGKPCSGIGNLIKHRMKCFASNNVKDEEDNDLDEETKEPVEAKNEPECDVVIKEEIPDTMTSYDSLDTTTEDTYNMQDHWNFDNANAWNKSKPDASLADTNKPDKETKKNLACHLCHKILANKRYLKDHMLKKHSEANRVVCEYCAKEFKSTNIKSHIKEMHINAIESKCPVCDKVFPRKKPMIDHMRRVHTEETRVVCQFCAKDVKSTNIKNHIKEMHTDVRETKCPICDKVFPRKKPMTDHMRLVHSDEKAVCELCSKTFENRTYLLRHIRTFHSKSELLFTCDFCLKQYKSALQLRNHIKIVHVVNNVECGICGKVYKNKILLGKHHRKYHRDSESTTRVRDYHRDPSSLGYGIREYQRDSETSEGIREYHRDSENSEGIREYQRDSESSTGTREYQRDSENSTGIRHYHRDSESSTGIREYQRDSESSTGIRDYQRDSESSKGIRDYHRDSESSTGIRDYHRDSESTSGFRALAAHSLSYKAIARSPSSPPSAAHSLY